MDDHATCCTPLNNANLALPALQSLLLDKIDASSHDGLLAIAVYAPRQHALVFRKVRFTDYGEVEKMLDMFGVMKSMRKSELDNALPSAGRLSFARLKKPSAQFCAEEFS